MTAWPIVRVRDIAGTYDGPHATPKSSKTATNGPIFLGISSLNAGRLDFARSAFLSEEDLKTWTRRVTPLEGDVVFSYETRLGQAAIIPTGFRGSLGRRLALMRPDRSKVDPRFLLYYYLGPTFQEVIRKNTVQGSTVDRIMLRDFPDFPVELPSLDEQRGIATTLGALDEKIDSNRRAIDIAESFGDAILADTSDSASTLSDVAAVVMGSSPPGSSYNEGGNGLPFYQGVRDFGRRFPGHRVWTTRPVRMAEPNDTLVSVRAPVGVLNRSREACCVGRGVAAIHSPHASTLYYALRAASDAWVPYQNEGTVFGAINKTDMAAVRVPWPSDVESVESTLSALDARIESLDAEIERLGRLRDLLLTELLSGRIRVPEAQEALA